MITFQLVDPQASNFKERHLKLIIAMDISIGELTRRAILSGRTPSNWIGLLTSLLDAHGIVISYDIGMEICKAMFKLMPAYGSVVLLPYFRTALMKNLITLTMIISLFYESNQTPKPPNLGSISSVAQFILDLHFASQHPVNPPATIIPNTLSQLSAIYRHPLSSSETQLQ